MQKTEQKTYESKGGTNKFLRNLKNLLHKILKCFQYNKKHRTVEVQYMIKDNQKVFNRLMVIIDAAITAASFMFAYFFKFYILNDGPGPGVLPVTDYLLLLVFIVPMYMLIYYLCSVYAPKRTVRRRFEIYGILKANTIGIIALIIILFMIFIMTF